MGLLLFWLFFGALIGLWAANAKGLSAAGGIIGGMFLGLLSPLIFLVESKRRRCPQCQEWVSKKANRCPHCQSDIA